MNQVYAGGYSDWRLPSKVEAEDLFELNYDQMDWEEEIIHISTLFVSKCSNYIWTSDMDENKNVCRINLRNKESEYIDPNTQEHQAARLVRDK